MHADLYIIRNVIQSMFAYEDVYSMCMDEDYYTTKITKTKDKLLVLHIPK